MSSRREYRRQVTGLFKEVVRVNISLMQQMIGEISRVIAYTSNVKIQHNLKKMKSHSHYESPFFM